MLFRSFKSLKSSFIILKFDSFGRPIGFLGITIFAIWIGHSTFSIGMHWGTFILTDEPVLEPRERLKKIASETNINFYTVEPGIIIELY